MNNERKLNEALAKLHADYLDLTVKQQAYVVGEVGKTRVQVIDLLEEYATKNDIVSKARLNPLLRDLEYVEKSIRTTAESALITVMDEAAESGLSGTTDAIQSTLSQSVEFILTAKIAESVVLRGLTGKQPTTRNLATYLAEKTGPDGLKLSDRVWQFAGDQRAEMSNVLRRGIIRGDTTASMVRDIKNVYSTEDWKARRLALTESNTAYRTAIGYVAEQSKFVKALRLVPGAHHSPKCVAKAAEDRHGLGAGIFLPSDTDIYSIHPNCTAYTQYILSEEVR
ncbi:hypothetical protein J2T13_000149 [Paenibacillus sp. DS2015]|uniref:hypothetical protein n=1 Tax=Paenibacillus sp. DS2015 TaxID=3373917 RepID=UPI003D19F6EF